MARTCPPRTPAANSNFSSSLLALSLQMVLAMGGQDGGPPILQGVFTKLYLGQAGTLISDSEFCARNPSSLETLGALFSPSLVRLNVVYLFVARTEPTPAIARGTPGHAARRNSSDPSCCSKKCFTSKHQPQSPDTHPQLLGRERGAA